MQTQQQQYQSFQQQQQQQQVKGASSAVAAFAARLLSLSAHELAWLHEDGDLMRRFSDAQLHMESRLQTNQNKLYLQQQSYYDLYCRQQQQQSQHLILQAQHQHQQLQSQLVLDLSAGSQANPSAQTNNNNNNNKRPQQQQPLKQQHNHNRSNQQESPRHFNPKKMKLSEYHQQLNHQQPQQRFHASPSEREHETAAELLALARGAPDTPETSPQQTLSSPAPPPTSSSSSAAAAAAKQQIQAPQTTTRKQAKKYKGEFDEPTPEEVERRQRALASPANYHRAINQPELGECACVLGSHFRDNRSVEEMLQIIERWRQLPAAERARTKWDVEDLPLDIPLGDIKKYEDLRRQASRGRADFGGASKRKPLGIRGTRQFLLILYCLWGHPGRDDVMQREGYCPHCFAKIKKDNEQSTLVRVVNHFNMKHRRGANPRLSPHLQRDTNTTTTAASSTTTSGAASPVGARSPQAAAKTTTTVVSSSGCVKVEAPEVLVSSCLDSEVCGDHQQAATTISTIATPTSSSTTTLSA